MDIGLSAHLCEVLILICRTRAVRGPYLDNELIGTYLISNPVEERKKIVQL
jgi:hypothetical protein